MISYIFWMSSAHFFRHAFFGGGDSVVFVSVSDVTMDFFLNPLLRLEYQPLVYILSAFIWDVACDGS
jgi:hypothetical protein